MKTLSLLTALSSDTEEQIRAHGQLPCALLIDIRPTPDAHLRMDWRTQYRYDPTRRLDVAHLESMGYQVLLLTATESHAFPEGARDTGDTLPESMGKGNAPARITSGLPRQRENQGQTSGRVQVA